MSKKLDQLQIADLPTHKISGQARKVVRNDFEQVVTACARLASFASGTRPKTDGPIHSRQDELAVSDLVLFAIHARRLIECTTGKRRFSRVGVPFYRAKKPGLEIPIWKVINTIVHYDDLEIFRSTGHLHAFLNPGSVFEILANGSLREDIPPLMIIQSDETKPIMVEIGVMIEIFQKKILTPIIESCSEQEFFLLDEDEYY